MSAGSIVTLMTRLLPVSTSIRPPASSSPHWTSRPTPNWVPDKPYKVLTSFDECDDRDKREIHGWKLKQSEILKKLLGVQGAPGESRAKPWWGGQGGRSPPKLLKDSNLYTFGTPFLKCIGHVLTHCRIAYQPIMDAVRTVLSVKIDSAGWIWHLSTSNLIIAIF